MMVDSLATLSPNVADLSLEYPLLETESLSLPGKNSPYYETVWMEILPDAKSVELNRLIRWYEKNFPELEIKAEGNGKVQKKKTDEPVYISTPRGKDIPENQQARDFVYIINLARRIKYRARKLGRDPYGNLYTIMNDVGELKSLMLKRRSDPEDRRIGTQVKVTVDEIIDWANSIEELYSRKFIQIKLKDGVGVRGRLTEIFQWGEAGVLKVDSLDKFPLLIETTMNGESTDSTTLGELMHFLPDVVFSYLARNVNRPQLVDPRVPELKTWNDLNLNRIFLPEGSIDPDTNEIVQKHLPNPLDAVTIAHAQNFYNEFHLTDEEQSLRVGLINYCIQALSATIMSGIQEKIMSDVEKYASLMEIRNIISRNFGYILAAIESIIYFYEVEIGFDNIQTLNPSFEEKTTVRMLFVSPYKFDAMKMIDEGLQKINLRFRTRVGITMRSDMVIPRLNGKKTIVDFKSTVHYDGSFESKIKAIGYVLAEILKDVWGGSYNSNTGSVDTKGSFDQSIIQKILKKLQDIEFYFWGMKDGKVPVEITEDDIYQFLKLTKLYTQCKVASKTESTKEEKLALQEWLLEGSHLDSDEDSEDSEYEQ